MNKTLLTSILCYALYFSAYSQQSTVSGKIVDKDQTPLMWAIVSLETVDSTLLKSTNTDMEGFFIFNQAPGNYLLRVELIGYQNLYKAIEVNNSPVNLGALVLPEEAVLIDELVIDNSGNNVVQKGDTTQYNADQYKTNPDASADDLVTKMPGITSENGTVKAQGEEVKKVLVDGKPFFGDDPKAALKNIPAEMIDKVEVYDQKSTQARTTGYDDGEEEKTINLVTKPEFRTGTFGKLYAGAGYEDKYNLGGVLNSFNENRRITVLGLSNNINEQNFSLADLSGVASQGRRRRNSGANDFLVSQQGGITKTNAFGINYSEEFNEKLKLTASYFFNQNINDNNTALSRKYITGNSDGQVYDENSSNNSTNYNHRFQANLEYQLTENDYIQFRPSFSIQQHEGQNNLYGSTFQGDSMLNSTDNNFATNLTAFNTYNRLDWTHSMKKKGRSISVDLRQKIDTKDADNEKNILTTYTTRENDTLNQQSSLVQYEQYYSIDLDYTEPLSEKVNLRLSYEPSWSFNDADKNTYNFDPETQEYSSFDTLLSNVADSRFRTHEISSDLRYNHKKTHLRIGGGYKYATLDAVQEFPSDYTIKKNFNNFLPSATIRHKVSDNKGFWLYYRTRTNAPSITQLQEVLDNSNTLQLSTGNSDLKQDYEHRLFMKYATSNANNNSSFFMMLRGSVVNNYITKSTYLAENETKTVDGITLSPGSQLTQPVNMDGYYNFSLFTSYGKPWEALKSNLNANLFANYSRIPSLINEQENIVNNPEFGAEIVLSSNFSEKVDFTLSTRPSINYSFNKLSPALNTQYFNQRTNLRFYWKLWKGLVYRTELTHQYYAGLNDSFDPNYTLWNMSIGYKFLKDDRAELSLSVYDLLKQNNSLQRNTTENYIEDTETAVLQQFFMLTFRYDIRAFNNKASQK